MLSSTGDEICATTYTETNRHILKNIHIYRLTILKLVEICANYQKDNLSIHRGKYLIH